MNTFQEEFSLENYQFTATQLPTKMTYKQAHNVCSTMGEGWRLPSFEELYHMYQKSSTICSTRVGSKGAWCQETDHTGEPLLLSFDGTTHTAGHWAGDVNTDMFHYFVVLVKDL